MGKQLKGKDNHKFIDRTGLQNKKKQVDIQIKNLPKRCIKKQRKII